MTKPINEKPEVQYFSGAAKSINFLDRNASASIEAKRVQSFKSFVVTIDLHMHSNASDGILPPAEVVRLCAGNGVKLMSLTDHDTMKGIEEARAEAERLGIAFVPGIEISTRWGQKSIHVAAYNLNPNTEAFKAFFKGVDKKRIERGERMGKLLAACGCKGAFEGAMALAVHPGSLSRTHFAQWLLDAGYVDNYAQAFAVLAVLSAILAAGSAMFLKRLGAAGEPIFRTVFWFSAASLVISAVAEAFLSRASMKDLFTDPMLFAVGICTMGAQLAQTLGWGRGRPLLCACLQFSAILFAVFFGWLFFDEKLESFATVGIVIIIAAELAAAVIGLRSRARRSSSA